MDFLDPEKDFFQAYHLGHCSDIQGFFVKDLTKINEVEGDFSQVLVLDNTERAYSLQPENGVPIKNFEGDLLDMELETYTSI